MVALPRKIGLPKPKGKLGLPYACLDGISTDGINATLEHVRAPVVVEGIADVTSASQHVRLFIKNSVVISERF